MKSQVEVIAVRRPSDVHHRDKVHNVYLGDGHDNNRRIGHVEVVAETCHFHPAVGVKYGRGVMRMVNMLMEDILATPNFRVHKVVSTCED